MPVEKPPEYVNRLAPSHLSNRIPACRRSFLKVCPARYDRQCHPASERFTAPALAAALAATLACIPRPANRPS
jgi:hypothetical protein